MEFDEFRNLINGNFCFKSMSNTLSLNLIKIWSQKFLFSLIEPLIKFFLISQLERYVFQTNKEMNKSSDFHQYPKRVEFLHLPDRKKSLNCLFDLLKKVLILNLIYGFQYTYVFFVINQQAKNKISIKNIPWRCHHTDIFLNWKSFQIKV